jgi:DNA (cytosine-5)-methyltransferase 1
VKALDLFCGAGGASRGLQRAGFHVTGVDIRPQKRYGGDCFVLADALHPPFDLADFDFVWASPPCQAYTRVFRGQEHRRRNHPNLVPATRKLLAAHPLTVIENVVGAPIRPDLLLTGAQFDLDVVRDRVFECSFPVPFVLHRQHRGTVTNGDLATVAGKGVNNAFNLRRARGFCKWRDLPERLKKGLCERNSAAGWRAAMQIDWMTKDELAQAIPPAYSEFIAQAAISQMQRVAA